MTARDDIHSCSYECDRPACVRRQRDELRDMMYSRDDKKEVMRNDAGQPPEPRPVAPPGLSSDGPGVSKVALPEPALPGNPSSPFPAQRRSFYSEAQLESYAAARVAMARAAYRTNIWVIAKRYDAQERLFKPLMVFLLDPARQSVMRWHRAARGK